MDCRRSAHGPENMSDRRGQIVPSHSPRGESTEFAGGTTHHQRPVNLERSQFRLRRWRARPRPGTCKILQWWNTHCMDPLERSVTLSQSSDKQRRVGWTNVERMKQLRFIPDLHATDCGHARVWLILGTHTASSQIEFWRNRADWSKK
jgi:hypothetical protein